MALKALEQAGISPKEVQWVFLGPVDAKVALLNGSVDASGDLGEPYTTQMVKTNEGQILVSGKGLLPGNTFLAATDSALNDPQNAPRCRIISSAWPAPSAGPTLISTATAKRWGDHPLPAEIARAQFANRQSQAAAGRGNSGPTAGNGGLLSRQRPDPHPAGREADL